jgi:dihydrofolate reductase
VDIAIFAAVAENGVIGREGGMPWRLSSDLKRFKAQTMGKPLVMGRRTWESFPRRPLPGRENIVVTRNSDFRAEGAIRAGSLEEAVNIAREAGRGRPEATEICVIGGGRDLSPGHRTGRRPPFRSLR